MSDLATVLREMRDDLEYAADRLQWTAIDSRFHHLTDAADEIERLTARVEELEKALRRNARIIPFLGDPELKLEKVVARAKRALSENGDS